MSVKLTEAQKRVLSGIERDGLHHVFDVWGGYEWRQGLRKLANRTVDVLIENGLVAITKSENPYPGRRIKHADLTPAGRALLAQERTDGR